MTQEELEAVQKELSDEFDKLMQYSVISDFITARKELDAVLEQVNNVISFYVTGKTPDGGCSGSCSSCSGCH